MITFSYSLPCFISNVMFYNVFVAQYPEKVDSDLELRNRPKGRYKMNLML